MPKRSSDDFDLENTDELPVLLEPAEDVAEPIAIARHEDTAEHTELFTALRNAESEEALLADLTQRAEQIPALEAQIRVLTDGMRDLEERLAERDAQLERLRTAAAVTPEAPESSTATGRLATELADRDARIVELSMAVEQAEQAAAARSAELERLREEAKTREGEAEELRRMLAARSPADRTQPGDDLREAYSTLQSYIAGRHAWWDEMRATNARLAERATQLEQELAAGAKRLAAAEAFAAKESDRAVGLRAELVEYARRVDSLERELKLQRAPSQLELPASADAAASPGATATPHPPPSGPPASTPADPALASHAPPLLTDAVDAVPASVEVIAQLEAEVEYKRQQVAAQIVELRDREQQLHSAMSELGALRSELDHSGADVARLERTIVDKDRALEARDARIAALHEELKRRLERGASDFSLVDPTPVRRAASYDPENTPAPALICLTGDAPKRFALTKKTVTVGRGPNCDLQIITHFVSREHARLTVSSGATLIEDLGSRNGVFVNSVRVDRRHLQQGDLVTIGETQFRFVESMAH